jgi:aryl-alcohol dehydrogenase-like predicted oxidoreductase
MGSAGTFNVAEGEPLDSLREVLGTFHELGGRLFDTAPTYGRSEATAGRVARDLGISDDLFLASKISTPVPLQSEIWDAWRAEQGTIQEAGTLNAWDRDRVDLQQVHNLDGASVHLPALRASKEEGRVRYIGLTVAESWQYEALERLIESEPLDFIQVNYSVAERQAAERILPLAQDRGLAVIVNRPYGGGTIFAALRGRPLPEWAAEFGAASWGQFILKYALAHPTVTAVIPATSDPEHVVDNMGAGVGPLPDPEQRARIESFFDGL